ncbi:nuclear transport factor 2 family protein [Micrococcaceae bacterium Sec5.1]
MVFEPKNNSNWTLEEQVKLLLDERAIRDVIYRECRAKNRGDTALKSTCYFPDAVDHHEPFFVGNPYAAAKAGGNPLAFVGEMIQYVALQILIDIDGDMARVESYVQANKIVHQRSETGNTILRVAGNRHLDRFERRDGEWRIANRQFIPEWGFFQEVPPLREPISIYGIGTDAATIIHDGNLSAVRHSMDASDPSYHPTYLFE